MISKYEDVERLFEELDRALEQKVHYFIIGGAAMLYHGLKVGTKDVDIVVDSQREFIAAERALKKAGFTAKIPTMEYHKFDLNQIFVRDEFRIDLFQKTICKGFLLSESMRKRALQVSDLSHS